MVRIQFFGLSSWSIHFTPPPPTPSTPSPTSGWDGVVFSSSKVLNRASHFGHGPCHRTKMGHFYHWREGKARQRNCEKGKELKEETKDDGRIFISVSEMRLNVVVRNFLVLTESNPGDEKKEESSNDFQVNLSQVKDLSGHFYIFLGISLLSNNTLCAKTSASITTDFSPDKKRARRCKHWRCEARHRGRAFVSMARGEWKKRGKGVGGIKEREKESRGKL